MIKIKIIGPRFNRFLKRLNDNNINVYKINNNIITVNENDLDKINNLKTIYDIEIIEYSGIKKIIKNINSIFVLSLIISIIFLYINSKMILNINIITDDYGIKKLLNRELKANNIKKYSFIKDNYDQIEKKIINNNKNKIEWLEIENTGTTINVKVQTRIINNLEKQIPKMLNCKFEQADYKNLNFKNKVIYCDPPYVMSSHKFYKENFDIDEFWDWVREQSKWNKVFVSECNVPDDMTIVWQKECKAALGTSQKIMVEKLVTYDR